MQNDWVHLALAVPCNRIFPTSSARFIVRLLFASLRCSCGCSGSGIIGTAKPSVWSLNNATLLKFPTSLFGHLAPSGGLSSVTKPRSISDIFQLLFYSLPFLTISASYLICIYLLLSPVIPLSLAHSVWLAGFPSTRASIQLSIQKLPWHRLLLSFLACVLFPIEVKWQSCIPSPALYGPFLTSSHR